MIKVKYKFYMALLIVGTIVLGMAYLDKFPDNLTFPFLNERKNVLTIHGVWDSKTGATVQIICAPCGDENPPINESVTESPFIATYPYDGLSPVNVIVTANQRIAVSCSILVDGDVKDNIGDLMVAKCSWPLKGRR